MCYSKVEPTRQLKDVTRQSSTEKSKTKRSEESHKKKNPKPANSVQSSVKEIKNESNKIITNSLPDRQEKKKKSTRRTSQPSKNTNARTKRTSKSLKRTHTHTCLNTHTRKCRHTLRQKMDNDEDSRSVHLKLCFPRSSPSHTSLCPSLRPHLWGEASRSLIGSFCSSLCVPFWAWLPLCLPEGTGESLSPRPHSASTSASPCFVPPPPRGESGTWRRRGGPGAGRASL